MIPRATGAALLALRLLTGLLFAGMIGFGLWGMLVDVFAATETWFALTGAAWVGVVMVLAYVAEVYPRRKSDSPDRRPTPSPWTVALLGGLIAWTVVTA